MRDGDAHDHVLQVDDTVVGVVGAWCAWCEGVGSVRHASVHIWWSRYSLVSNVNTILAR